MKSRCGNQRRQRSGAAAVEFAVVVPVVIVILMAIFEYGRFMFTYTTATNAAREGARYAAVHTSDKTTAEVITQIDNRMGPAKSQLKDPVPASDKRKIFWADPGQFSAATPVITAKSGFTGPDDWKSTPFGDKIVCEINGTFHPVLASIFQASTSITVKVQGIVTCEAN